MILIRIVGKFIVILICLTGIFGFGNAFLISAKSQSIYHLIQLGSGALLFFLVWVFYLSRRENFWSILEHELTHALFALLFFKKVTNLNANRRSGGMVQMEGGNFVIALAPYFFPLGSVLIILIKPFFLSEYQWFLNGLLGFITTFHFIYLIGEFQPSQPDLKESGFLFSSFFVLFFNIFFLGLAFSSLSGDWANMLSFIENGGIQSWNYTKEGVIFLKTVLE